MLYTHLHIHVSTAYQCYAQFNKLLSSRAGDTAQMFPVWFLQILSDAEINFAREETILAQTDIMIVSTNVWLHCTPFKYVVACSQLHFVCATAS